MSSSTINNNCSETDDESCVIVHLDLCLHHHHNIGSTLLTNFYKSIPKFKINSTIIVKDVIALSNEIIHHTNSKSTPQLLYRGTRDGFKYQDFHSRCDNQGPTLTIIKSAEPYNQIFGGFTTQNWKPSDDCGDEYEYISDPSAFIFKINENQQFLKFNILNKEISSAIFLRSDCLPSFGYGHDIFIYRDCHLNTYSYSNFGYTYELPKSSSTNDDEFQFGSEKARKYLAGRDQFKVLEIEVFKITTNNTAIQ